MTAASEPLLLDDDTPFLELAGNGDRVAQSIMLDHVIASAMAGRIPLGIALGSAEVFARMAAASGETRDTRRLSGVLLWQAENLWNSGHYDRSRIYQAEAVGLLNHVADNGDEQAGALLSQYAGMFNPEIITLAGELIQPAATRANDGTAPVPDITPDDRLGEG